jgi:hypothetical protein
VFQAFQRWLDTRRIGAASLGAAVLMLTATLAIVAFHPMLKVARLIAQNDGYLVFGFPPSWISGVVVLSAAIGGYNLWRRLMGGGAYVDAILGAATLASAGVIAVQYAMWRVLGEGSPYAVKKHVFIIVTLGAMNAARLVVGYWRPSFERAGWRIGAPVAAMLATTSILWGLGVPVEPALEALRYANHMARFGLPALKAGNTIDAEVGVSPLVNLMVSFSAFQYPRSGKAYAWPDGGVPPAEYAMVRNTAEIDQICPERFGESATYVVIKTTCLNIYLLGSTINFAAGGNSWRFRSGGWDESWGMWSFAKPYGEVTLTLPERSVGPYELKVNALAFVNPAHPMQTVKVIVNDAEVAAWTFDQGSSHGERSATIPAALTAASKLKIHFLPVGTVSPAQIGVSPDRRVLGIGIKDIKIIPASHKNGHRWD